MVKLNDFYGRRFQYHWPHHVTRPWLPALRLGADEFCNTSVWVTFPFLGAVVFFYGRKLRTFDDGWCQSCRDAWNADSDIPYQVGMMGVVNGEPIFMNKDWYEA